MKLFLKRILGFLYYIYNLVIGGNDQKKNIGYWFYINGDERYLLSHSLNSDSVVFDVGGYKGVFTDRVLHKYNPQKIYIFEPVSDYYLYLVEKYKSRKNVILYNFGLADCNKQEYISIREDGSSVYRDGNKKEKISLVDISEFIRVKKIKNIDLMSINIEGGEYPLINKLLDSGLVKRVDVIQVQFHKISDASEDERQRLVNRLLETHKKVYSFPFLWEGFKRK